MINKIVKKYRQQGVLGILKSAKNRLESLLTTISIKVPITQSETKLKNDATKFWNTNPDTGLSHWCGSGIWQREHFENVGNKHFEMFENLCKFTGVSRPIHRMVEWGPGGGVNAIRFSKEVSKLYCVDISENNLAECGRQLLGYTGFRPIHINIDHPENVFSHIQEPCDLFLATALYPHFPSKEYGINITKIAYQLLSPSGLAILHILIDDGSNQYRPKKRNYQSQPHAFTTYRADEFWNIATYIGFKPLYITWVCSSLQ